MTGSGEESSQQQSPLEGKGKQIIQMVQEMGKECQEEIATLQEKLKGKDVIIAILTQINKDLLKAPKFVEDPRLQG